MRSTFEVLIPSKDNEKSSRFDMVGLHYFSTVGIPMLLGRELTQQDTSASPHVCVVNEAFAKLFFAVYLVCTPCHSQIRGQEECDGSCGRGEKCP